MNDTLKRSTLMTTLDASARTAILLMLCPPLLLQAHAQSSGVSLYSMRSGEGRAELLKKLGGTDASEAAVKKGLQWLQRQQQPSGLWSLQGPYSEGSAFENETAATGLALLAFQGAGHSSKSGDYKPTVIKAWRALVRLQEKSGRFGAANTPPNHRFYTHAIVTLAACESFGLTGDRQYRVPAEKAVQYLVKYQHQDGGWRYYESASGREKSDTSVTSWVLSSLHAARSVGIKVPDQTFANIQRYLDAVTTDKGSQYTYLPGHTPRPSMTAAGLTSRQLLGWKKTDERMLKGVGFVAKQKIDYESPDFYFWYYATQMMRNMEGEHWNKWNAAIMPQLLNHQLTAGPNSGSWSTRKGRWHAQSGRLFQTCMALVMLESYYRHPSVYNMPKPKAVARPAPKPEQRKWTDRSGKFAVDAKLVRLEGAKVVLKKKDGNEFSVPIRQLSIKDQMYLQRWKKSQGTSN